jgi:hypothetical protein
MSKRRLVVGSKNIGSMNVGSIEEYRYAPIYSSLVEDEVRVVNKLSDIFVIAA